jgi:hypothetical protein
MVNRTTEHTYSLSNGPQLVYALRLASSSPDPLSRAALFAHLFDRLRGASEEVGRRIHQLRLLKRHGRTLVELNRYRGRVRSGERCSKCYSALSELSRVSLIPLRRAQPALPKRSTYETRPSPPPSCFPPLSSTSATLRRVWHTLSATWRR